MKALMRFIRMFCTAGTLLFVGLDVSGVTPKHMMRKDGHPIITEVENGKNRYGEPTRYARYRMGGIQ